MFFDLPYGVLDPEKTGVKWDVKFTREQLDNLLRQFEAIQRAQSWFVCFMCNPSQMGEIMDALTRTASSSTSHKH